jgi:hypothetical protein
VVDGAAERGPVFYLDVLKHMSYDRVFYAVVISTEMTAVSPETVDRKYIRKEKRRCRRNRNFF